MPADGHKYTIKGFKNVDLLAPGYKEQRQTWRNGKLVAKRTSKVIDEASNCWYQGHVDGRQGHSRVAFSTCSGSIRGAVMLHNENWIIEPAHRHLDKEALDWHLKAVLAKDEHKFSTGHKRPSHKSLHIVYKSEDVTHPHFSCIVGEADDPANGLDRHLKSSGDHHDPHDHDHDHDHDHGHDHDHFRGVEHFLEQMNAQLSTAQVLMKRSTDQKAVGQQYVELIVVNDKRRFSEYREEPEEDSVDIVNLANSYYVAQQDFDPPISVVLINQITFDDEDPWEAANPVGTCSSCSSGEVGVDTLLSEFNSWRGDTNNIETHDNAQLFSGHNFQGGVLGYAAVGAVCQYSRSSGIDMAVQAQSLEFTTSVVAHELGHNLGSYHDSSSNVCPSSGFIMNAEVSSVVVPDTFSSCSEAYINSYMGRSSVTCTMNVPTNQWGDPQCQNGWVEVGEDCDCGQADCSTADPPDPCCDGSTCQFAPGALCSANQECCDDCQPKPGGTLCRDMSGDEGCDLAEYCDGVTGSCPSDGTVGAGADCTFDILGSAVEGLCYLGSCYSAYRQCYESGESFDNGPYNECPYHFQAQLNGWNEAESTLEEQEEFFCGPLWCQNDPSSCTYFQISGQVATVDDGVPCSETGRKQCLNSQCVDSGMLNQEYQWVATRWNDCSQCDEEQNRTVACENVEFPGVPVLEALCSAAAELATTQLCQNETLACDHNQGLAEGELDIFGFIVSKNTLVFASLGGLSALAILLLLCYNAVTYEDLDERHKSTPNPIDAELHS